MSPKRINSSDEIKLILYAVSVRAVEILDSKVLADRIEARDIARDCNGSFSISEKSKF